MTGPADAAAPAAAGVHARAGAPTRADKQAFHLMPESGWINDPNGPLLHGDTYHMFYQHVPGSAAWEWGLCWGHAVSTDLVHWRHLPVALRPTPGSLDQDGCFSGSATLDEDGVPVILYTGVVRKPVGSHGSDVSPQYEFQLIARPADPSDPDLTHWVTEPFAPFLPAPAFAAPPAPRGAPRPPVPAAAIAARDAGALGAAAHLTGWRDPFVVARPGGGDPHFYVIVGAGERGRAGMALMYKSESIHGGWQYVGELCRDAHCRMLECPLLFPLPHLPHRLAGTAGAGAATNGAGRCRGGEAAAGGGGESADGVGGEAPRQHVFCYSADYCANVSEYHIGPFAPSSPAFDLAAAGPPSKMDLGDVFYAPNVLADKQCMCVSCTRAHVSVYCTLLSVIVTNVLADKQGRAVLWAWMQERDRPAGDHDHACCLSLPRCLWLAPPDAGAGDGAAPRLWQEPLPELRELRRGGPKGGWSWRPAAARGEGRAAAGGCRGHADGGAAADGRAAANGCCGHANGHTAANGNGGGASAAAALRVAPHLAKGHLDIELEVAPPAGAATGAAAAFALVLHPLASGGGGEGAAVVFSWETGALQVVHSTDPAAIAAAARAPPPQPHRLCGFPDAHAAAGAAGEAAGRDVGSPADMEYGPGPEDGLMGIQSAAAEPLRPADAAGAAAAPPPGARRCGGRLRGLPGGGGGPLGLRVLVDHSLVEVFTSTGEALATRVYRGGGGGGGAAAAAAAAGGEVELLLFGGAAAARVDAWEVDSIWAAAAAAPAAAPRCAALEAAAAVARAGVAAAAGGGGASAFGGCGELREALERYMQEQEAAAAAATATTTPSGGGGLGIPPAACRRWRVRRRAGGARPARSRCAPRRRRPSRWARAPAAATTCGQRRSAFTPRACSAPAASRRRARSASREGPRFASRAPAAPPAAPAPWWRCAGQIHERCRHAHFGASLPSRTAPRGHSLPRFTPSALPP
ncbi:MAG: glycosyl hydrolase [Monoraphidium minutum]|nr:MAG: glycosyl hydrolase [Monoraphidium minutum]